MRPSLTLSTVRADVAEQLYLEADEIDDDDDLFDSGLDSIRLMSLVERWREAGAAVSYVDLAERPTLSAWWPLLDPGQAGAGRA